MFERFKKPQQTKSVEKYYDKVEKYRGQLLKMIPSLTDEYFLEIIGGFQNEIKEMWRLLDPNHLAQALKLARYYEQTLNNQPKRLGSV